MRLTLNISPCPNDTFMFDGLVNGRIDTRGYGFDVRFADIEELNGRVMGASGAPDISKISYAAWPAIRDRYTLLDSGSALGHGNGPVFVCRHNSGFAAFVSKIARPHTSCMLPRDSLRQRCTATALATNTSMVSWRVAIPGIHTTANLLLQKLYPGLTDRRPMLFSDIAPAVAQDEVDAGVLIHEGRFTYRDHGLELVADLGVEWDKATGGLPLPLGAIVASRTLPAGIVRDVEEMIRESIEYGFANPGASREFIKSHAREMDDAVIDNHIRLFVNDNSLTLSPRAKHAVHALTGVE